MKCSNCKQKDPLPYHNYCIECNKTYRKSWYGTIPEWQRERMRKANRERQQRKRKNA